ncbi:MAG: TolC family protein [bacterium]
MKKRFLFFEIWLLLSLCSLSWAENLGRITLPQAIDLALEKNYTLKSLQAQLDSARAKVQVSRSGYFPKIAATGGIQKTKVLSDTQKSVTFSNGDRTMTMSMDEDRDVNQGTISFTLSQNIFDFGRRYYALQKSKSGLQATEENLAETRNGVIFGVEKTFYGYFQSVNLLNVARESVRQFELQLQQAKARNETGLVPLIDVTTARMNLATARSRLQQAQSDVTLAKAALAHAIGLDFDDEYEPVEAVKASKPVPPLEELLRLLTSHNPAIRQAQESVRFAELALKAAEGEYWPTVSGHMDYMAQGDDFPFERKFILGLQIDIPLFTGGATYYRVKDALVNIRQSQAILEQVTRDAQLAVVEDFTNYEKTLSQMDSLKEAGDAAEANLEMASARYQVGLGDIIEWTNASLSLIVTKTDYVNANYNLLMIFAKLKRDIGVAEL